MVKFRRIQLKYRAHNILNGFSGFPVSKNPMLEKRIFNLSPIGKKLAGPYRVLGGHLGFWPPRAGVTTKFVRTKFFLFPKVSLRICNRSRWAVGGVHVGPQYIPVYNRRLQFPNNKLGYR